ncbi:hypothetical protein B0T16DRAFT_361168, partial [Cercophora newfieldiana]
MSCSGSPVDLGNFEPFQSRYEDSPANIGYSIARNSEAFPMAAASKKAQLALSGPDSLIFRLEKLFWPSKDLGSILTTFNYGLYLLAYFDGKAHKLKSDALTLLTLLTKSPAVAGLAGHMHPEAEASPFAKLGMVVSNTRTTLRLFGLLPIYVRARKLMIDSQGMDKVLWAVEAVQCSLFATFQLLENVAFLTDNGILSRRPLGDAAGVAGRVARLYRLAHRAWFLGIMCDFARLLREAQIFFRRKHIDETDLTEDEVEKAAQWYSDWIRPLAWLPIGWQLSAWTEEGMAGFNNLGVQGIAGVLADL